MKVKIIRLAGIQQQSLEVFGISLDEIYEVHTYFGELPAIRLQNGDDIAIYPDEYEVIEE